MENIDKQEVKKFSDLAADWWNEDGDFKPLHVIKYECIVDEFRKASK